MNWTCWRQPAIWALKWKTEQKADTEPRHRRLRVISLDDEKREFEKLYKESYELVFGYVRSRMINIEATEDVVSEAFCRAARAFKSYDPTRAKFSTWVVTIAHNCMISYYRKERPTAALDDLPELSATESADISAVEDIDVTMRLLSVLDEEECQLVLFKYREDMRNVEIAAELGMNASTVATKISRALTKMRAYAHDIQG